jgi:hypothetical protein
MAANDPLPTFAGRSVGQLLLRSWPCDPLRFCAQALVRDPRNQGRWELDFVDYGDKGDWPAGVVDEVKHIMNRLAEIVRNVTHGEVFPSHGEAMENGHG